MIIKLQDLETVVKKMREVFEAGTDSMSDRVFISFKRDSVVISQISNHPECFPNWLTIKSIE